MGGTTVNQPSAPSVSSNISDWVENYPAVFALQQQYAPQEAAQQVALAEQYAAPLGTAFKSAQEAMYPNEAALSNQLTQIAQQGISGSMPDWAKQSYMDTMRAQLGENAMSGVGADYMSTGLLQQQEDWNRYYQNLGLSIAGRQPIYSASTPTTSNYTSTFTPSSILGYNAQNYSTAANMYNRSSGTGNGWGSILGSIGGSILGGMAGGAFGYGGMLGQALK